MTCFPASTHVSISLYALELEKKSSVAVTFMLFVNARLTFSPVKYPYCVLRRLLLSIQYPNVEEIYINVSVPFILKKLPIAFLSVSSLTNYLDILLNDRNCNIQSNNHVFYHIQIITIQLQQLIIFFFSLFFLCIVCFPVST